MWRWLWIVVVGHSLSASGFQEVSEWKELFKFVDKKASKETLFVFDIDNTLLQAKQQLGSVAWADNMAKELLEKGFNKQDAFEVTCIFWRAVQPHIAVEPVDPTITELMRKISKKGSPVLYLTARAPQESEYTHKQLETIGIALPKQSAWKSKDCLLERNVLFATVYQKKSKVLLDFLAHNQLNVSQVVFVDDKQSHVDDVLQACQHQGIECVGVRFGGADKQHAVYDAKVSAVQWEAFPQILSDQDAISRLH